MLDDSPRIAWWRPIATLLVGIAALSWSAPASGTVVQEPEPEPEVDPGPCLQGCDVDGGGGLDGPYVYSDARVFGPGSEGGSTVPTGSSYLDDCAWQRVEAGETAILHPLAGAWEVTFDEPHWLVWCAPYTLVYAQFPVVDGPPQAIIDDMIRDAYYRTPVSFFNPQTSPEGTEDIAIIVQARTWLWVDEALWEPVTAEAEIPGVITVTTTAEPYLATWTGGDDPDVVECFGPGSPYVTGIGEENNDDTCTTVFTRDSTLEPDRQIEVSVRWQVSYSCTAFCGGGPLPDIVTESSRPVLVTEIQSVGT